MVNKKIKSLIIQANVLKKHFPKSVIKVKKSNLLIWQSTIQPTPLSEVYTIELCSDFRGKKNVLSMRVIYPFPLPLANRKDKLPHVYSHEKQILCLYYPHSKEFNYNKLFAKTLIPWTSEWLLHYETWVCTGVWNGGGIEHH